MTFTYNNDTLLKQIYRNGVKLSITNEISTGKQTANNYIIFGALEGFGTQMYIGNIDDYRLYTGKVLDQEEISRIYNGAKTDYTTPIIEPTIGYPTVDVWSDRSINGFPTPGT